MFHSASMQPKSIDVYGLHTWLTSEEENPVIIDVREDVELNIAKFPFTEISIPISQVTIELVESKLEKFSKKKFVVLCHRGIRSYNFGLWLLENGIIDEVWNLSEGIDGWSRDIDPSIPRY
tara:strand:- start:42 stop:404 length:363 start_codon:yes stop_codon:yes gene_type:complete